MNDEDTRSFELPRNIRHLRVLLAIEKTGSVSRAAELCQISQPAVTQALSKVEETAGEKLFTRGSGGLFPTEAGRVVLSRTTRALNRLDDALVAISPRLKITATYAQLRALVAVVDAANYSLAARRMGLAQPTLHRAVGQISAEAQKPILEKTSHGVVATRKCRDLAVAAELADAELTQAETELAELAGREVGRIVVGALPLSRSSILPPALAHFRAKKRKLLVTVVDGTYEDLLRGLRRGEIDFLIGALRDPLPVADIKQEVLFEDGLAIIARPDHQLAGLAKMELSDMADRDWLVPRAGTPSRAQFDAVFSVGEIRPRSVVETGSVLLMRELLQETDMLGCISQLQAQAEVSRGLLVQIPHDLPWGTRPIGLTTRKDFAPTPSQELLLDLMRSETRRFLK